MSMTRFYFYVTILTIITSCVVTSVLAQQSINRASIYGVMEKVADWQWQELEKNGWKNDPKDWTSGVMYTGMVAWAKIANEDSYWRKLVDVGNLNRWEVGRQRYFADDYCVGYLYAQLYKKYGDPKYIEDFRTVADSLIARPHSESLLWVNNIYYREWAWCDALYMGPSALAGLWEATNEQKYLDLICKLWRKTSDYLYNKNQHLFFRDSRYFGQHEKNGKEVFWSRGNGWVMGGMVNTLSVMPLSYPGRSAFIRQFKQLAERIASLQQPDGTWHASLLDPESYPAKETSGTALFCYALAWGINQKILPAVQYNPVVGKAWQALVEAVHADGKLGSVQPQGVSPEKVTADDTEVYGVGAFLLAGTEMLKLNK